MDAQRFAIIALVLVAAASGCCDADGMHGGGNGAATQYCQQALARIADASPESLASACKGCCLQEVPYEGRMVNGSCVCYR